MESQEVDEALTISSSTNYFMDNIYNTASKYKSKKSRTDEYEEELSSKNSSKDIKNLFTALKSASKTPVAKMLNRNRKNSE